MPREKPNVLIFCVDEMRADHLGSAGNPIVQTPNLDRLAAEEVLFRRSYCNNPICMPARATMFTGLLPRDHGLLWKGTYTFQGCINIPTIVSMPGGLCGITLDALTAQIDLLPSVLQFCRVTMPESDWVQQETSFQRGAAMPLHTHPGRSYLGLLQGISASIREAVAISPDSALELLIL